MTTLDFGKRGEDAAASYLKTHGHKIIDRNFRIRGGEIDIISLDGKTLVFTEVKTRTNTLFGSAFEAIHSQKLHFLIKAAQFYQLSHPRLPQDIRFDAIEVYSENGRFEINHIKNITM